MNSPPTLCRYATDPKGLIVFVDDGWCEFAAANAAPDYAVRDRLYGRPLLSFISDSTTLHIYAVLMARVIERQEAVVVPFRCDAPPLRRWLELEMSWHEGGVQFATRQMRTEPRLVPMPFDRPGTRTDLLLRMCSWCKDVELADGTWGSIETAVEAFELFRDPEVPGLTHGICPPCMARFEGGTSPDRAAIAR